MSRGNVAGLPRGAYRLYHPEAVSQALDEMAVRLTEAVGSCQPLVLVVLTGGLYTGAWLTQRLPFALEIDFIRVSRYRSGTESGQLEWLLKPRASPAGRTVVLIDDVWDEGITMAHLKQWLTGEGAQQVLSTVLVWKSPVTHSLGSSGPDIYGLRAGHEWLLGCGLDLDGQWRHLPAIYALSEIEPLRPAGRDSR